MNPLRKLLPGLDNVLMGLGALVPIPFWPAEPSSADGEARTDESGPAAEDSPVPAGFPAAGAGHPNSAVEFVADAVKIVVNHFILRDFDTLLKWAPAIEDVAANKELCEAIANVTIGELAGQLLADLVYEDQK